MGEPQEAHSLEEQVVDDYLSMRDNGGDVLLSEGDDWIVLADNEYISKRDVRDRYERIKNILEDIVHDGMERQRCLIATEKKTAEAVMHAAMDKKGCEERAAQYIVVDTSPGWERALHFGRHGWLGQASEGYPTTIFDTTEKAEQAIKSTREFENGRYSWSNNKFTVLQLF